MVRLLLLTLLLASCNEHFNAGQKKYDKLPVDGRNPVVLLNDSPNENWMGEYAMLLANSGGPKLVGIIVVTGGVNKEIEDSAFGWQDMVEAAQAGGLREIPDPTTSPTQELERPSSGIIDDTLFSRSPGANLIVNLSNQLSQPYCPLVVVAGSRLTDVAKAYLIDKTVRDRVVVVASVGKVTSTGGADMYRPNGEMDPWASTIVATKFQYIQVSARYDSQLDIPEERLPELPRNNKFSDWIYRKQPNIWSLTDAADQVAIQAVGIPGFADEVVRVSVDPTVDAGSTAGPNLRQDPNGTALLVRGILPDVAINRLWQMLKDPALFPSPAASADAK